MIERLNAALTGRYVVERELGAGGMATVFLAQDVKHDRQVAIKVLKPELAAVVGGDRFLAEIRTTANLQDPHILPLYDSGQADAFLFYVMPYVEGDSLRERLDREGQLPVADAVEIARKVAGALQYAHDEGVVHRDVKPANVLLRRGEPLVADFGIALAVSQAGGGRITETGLSLGTPHYMSPEQASGERTLDPRSDVYALGCVLFEMLTGETPHPGPTAQSVLAKILTEVPRRARELRSSVPPHVDAAIARALEKIPADRFASAQAFAEALGDASFTHERTAAYASAPASGGVAVAKARASRPWMAATVVLGVTSVALGTNLGLRRPVETAGPVFRAALALPEDQGLMTPQFGSSIALSPDGSILAYTGSATTEPWQIMLRRADALEATPVPGSGASISPVFSPDGTALAFSDPTGRLRVADLERGSTRVLADSSVTVVDWTREGTIYFLHGITFGDLWRVDAAGGEPEPVPGLSGPVGPIPEWGEGDVLPGEEAILITAYAAGAGAAANAASVVAFDLTTGQGRTLVQGSDPTYLDSGHLLWASREGNLMVAPFDPETLELTGSPSALAEEVLTDLNGTMHYAASESGSLVYRTGGVASDVGGLTWVNRDGTSTPASDLELGLTVGLWDALDLSPDGSTVAFSSAEGFVSHLWVQDLVAASPPRRITFEGSLNVRPRWTAGGDSLVYVTNAAGPNVPTQVWIKAADGTGAPRPLVVADVEVEEGMLSPDGEWVLYRTGGTAANRDLFAMRRADGEVKALFATDANERSLALSPDGRWMAWVSNETGRDEVFVAPFPDVERGRWQVTQSGGGAPAWSRDGTELHYVSSSGQLVAARYSTTGGSFSIRSVEPLFPAAGLLFGPNFTTYAIAPDDERFLMISVGGRSQDLVWVQNWPSELGR